MLLYLGNECVICLENFKDPVITRCKHTFCRGCINQALVTSPYCPICKVALRAIVGNQPPNGKMTTEVCRVLCRVQIEYRLKLLIFLSRIFNLCSLWQFNFLPFQILNFSLHGYEGYKTIKITYYIPNGTQGPNHPNPGVRYTGATRCAYLPDSPEGREVLTVCQVYISFLVVLLFLLFHSSCEKPLMHVLLSLWVDLWQLVLTI